VWRCVAGRAVAAGPTHCVPVSRRNREKRAAKQKARRRAAAGRERTSLWAGIDAAGSDRAALLGILTHAVRSAARCPCSDLEQHAADLVEEFPGAGSELDSAAECAVIEMIGEVWQGGWLPSDLDEIARRRCDAQVAGYLGEAIIIESRQYPPAMVHPMWRAAVARIRAGLDAGVDLSSDAPHPWQWAARNASSRAESLGVVLRLLAFLGSLPVLGRLLPLPGQNRHSVAATEHEVDEKALARVRALLAKAESTEFPEEAEALSAKAQELMSRYSLHQAITEHHRGCAVAAAGRRLWMDVPYTGAKALLVQVVATANRCRAVWSEKLGFITVVGAETDLDLVELLSTSLLVQANRAMLGAGRHVTRAGTSRTRSFRQSFLLAYAGRIGERLDTASAAATADVAQEVAGEVARSGGLLPVLAARSRAADELTHRLFPTMTHRALSVSNAAGWCAGRAAAELALFDVHASIAG